MRTCRSRQRTYCRDKSFHRLRVVRDIHYVLESAENAMKPAVQNHVFETAVNLSRRDGMAMLHCVDDLQGAGRLAASHPAF